MVNIIPTMTLYSVVTHKCNIRQYTIAFYLQILLPTIACYPLLLVTHYCFLRNIDFPYRIAKLSVSFFNGLLVNKDRLITQPF